MQKSNIIFAVFAASILILGWELYDIRQELNDLNSSLRNSITLRTFNFTIVLSDTTHSKSSSGQNGEPLLEWGEKAALENVTLTSTSRAANTLNIPDVLSGSRPLDVYDIGFPFSKGWISPPPPPHPTVKVNALGYSFNGAAMNTTELTPYENQSGYTIAVTYYTFRGQVDLLYPTIVGNATFYLTLYPDQQFSAIENIKDWYKVVSLPQS